MNPLFQFGVKFRFHEPPFTQPVFNGGDNDPDSINGAVFQINRTGFLEIFGGAGNFTNLKTMINNLG